MNIIDSDCELAILPLPPRPRVPPKRIRHHYSYRRLSKYVCDGSKHSAVVEGKVEDGPREAGVREHHRGRTLGKRKTRQSNYQGDVDNGRVWIDHLPGRVRYLGARQRILFYNSTLETCRGVAVGHSARRTWVVASHTPKVY